MQFFVKIFLFLPTIVQILSPRIINFLTLHVSPTHNVATVLTVLTVQCPLLYYLSPDCV